MHDAALRTVFFVRHDPHPAVGGAALRNWQNILACARLGPVQVICAESKTRETAAIGSNITFRYYGGEEMRLLPDALTSRLGKAPRRAYSRIARALGTGRLRQAVERDIAAFAPALAIFEEYKCATLASTLRGAGVSVIYDAHNVEARLQRSLTAGRTVGRGERRYIAGIMEGERSLASIADQAWVCSEVERTNMRREFPWLSDVRIIPNAIDPLKYAAAFDRRLNRQPGDPPCLIFAGSYEYPPNQRAAHLIVGQIFPEIAAVLPEARLILAGRAPTIDMMKAARKNARISVTGAVPDIAPYLERSQIALVPLHHGGGTRFKILEAFASGSAVISTRKGAEGLSVVHGRHLLFAETTHEFSSAALRLWQDVALRQSIIREARHRVITHYSAEIAQRLVECAVRDAVRIAPRVSQK